MQAKFCKIWVVLLLEQQKREREDAPRSYNEKERTPLEVFEKPQLFLLQTIDVLFTTDRCIHVKLQKKKKIQYTIHEQVYFLI